MKLINTDLLRDSVCGIGFVLDTVQALRIFRNLRHALAIR